MRSSLWPALFVCSALATAGAQSIPTGAKHLAWANLDIVSSPDSAGAVIWAQLKNGSAEQQAGATMTPPDVESWAIAAHEFLAHPLADADTGKMRVSRVLRGVCGEDLYLVRRRLKGTWSNEHLLVIESPRDSQPLIVSGTKRDITEIVTNLAIVASRSPYDEEAAKRLALEEKARVPLDSPPKMKRTSLRPQFPEAGRWAGQDGLVLLTFTVLENGEIEPGTDRPYFATDASFLAEVRRVLPHLRFDPAMKDGRPIRLRVSMPFQFTLRR